MSTRYDEAKTAASEAALHHASADYHKLVTIWRKPYEANVEKDALGYFTVPEAARLFDITTKAFVNSLNAASHGYIENDTYHAEWED